jgi:hypothetical protein
MSKKKPAKPVSKTAKTARRHERSKGELSSDDLDSVDGGAGSSIPTESISFNFSKVGITVLPADPDEGGELGGQVRSAYDLNQSIKK